MHGPTKRAGSVGCLEDIAEAAAVAKAIMDHTDHIMLVGAGAKKFAIEMGFKTQNLLTEQSRRDWLRWKAKLNPSDNWLDPVDRPPDATSPAGAEAPVRRRASRLTGHARLPRRVGRSAHVRHDQHERRDRERRHRAR